jgi:hypothetical protein
MHFQLTKVHEWALFWIQIKSAKFEGLTRTIHDKKKFCQINDGTLPNLIKRKQKKGQGPKYRQANSPKEAGHKEEREPLRTKPCTSRLKHIN